MLCPAARNVHSDCAVLSPRVGRVCRLGRCRSGRTEPPQATSRSAPNPGCLKQVLQRFHIAFPESGHRPEIGLLGRGQRPERHAVMAVFLDSQRGPHPGRVALDQLFHHQPGSEGGNPRFSVHTD